MTKIGCSPIPPGEVAVKKTYTCPKLTKQTNLKNITLLTNAEVGGPYDDSGGRNDQDYDS